jgi:signal transduction histidine kinase/CheY-like chemotaxis protein
VSDPQIPAEDLAALRRTVDRETRARRALEEQLDRRNRQLADTYRELQRAYEELDQRVNERTRALTEANVLLQSEIRERQRVEDELREARDRAEVATDGLRFALEESERLRNAAEVAVRAKAEFLANMSHEIRTPMNGVLGMVQLLETTSVTPVQKQYLETARASADALLGLLNDILDLSKIEAGGMEVQQTPFDLREMLGNLGDLLAAKAHEKDVDLLVRYAADLPRALVGDSDRIRQILVNLIGNAVKFTPSGHVLLDAACEAMEDEGAQLVFSVCDTGIGIEDDKLEEVFDKFTQADSSTTRLYGGTGLGLAISRDLAKLMGGRIEAESRVGHGSTFRLHLTLPVAEPAPAAPPPAEGTALVHDPSPLPCGILIELLGSQGVSAGPVDTVEALAKRLAGDGPPPRWILTAVDSPADVEEVGRVVRERFPQDEPAIVAVTRLGAGADRTALLAAGARAIVMQPVRPSRLAEALKSAVRPRASGRGDSRCIPAPLPPAAAADSFAARELRVLVAEDNAVNRKVAEGILEKLGCRVVVASDGEEALARVREEVPDLVFMDCQMPRKDGYEATREIRSLAGAASDVPIVAMTAHAMDGDRQKCLDAGMNDYVAKPVKIAVLRDVIARWCAQPVL